MSLFKNPLVNVRPSILLLYRAAIASGDTAAADTIHAQILADAEPYLRARARETGAPIEDARADLVMALGRAVVPEWCQRYRAASGDDAVARAALEQIVSGLYPVIAHLAKDLDRGDYYDLLQVGFVAVYQAIEKDTPLNAVEAIVRAKMTAFQ